MAAGSKRLVILFIHAYPPYDSMLLSLFHKNVVQDTLAFYLLLKFVVPHQLLES